MNSTTHTQAAAPRLERPRDGRMITGVSAGIARHLGVNPVLIRLGFVVAVVAGGAGFLAYIAATLLVPEQGQDEPLLRSLRAPHAGLMLGFLLLVAATAGTADALTDGGIANDVVWSAALAAGGVYLLVAPRRDTSVVDAPTAETAVQHGGSRAATRTVAGLMVLVAAGVSAAATAGAHVGWQEALGIAVVGAGAALVVGSLFGASPWLVFLPLLVAASVGTLAAAGAALDGPIGDRAYHPAAAAELPSDYRVAIGALDVDLRELILPAGTTKVAVHVGIGEARVRVPAGIAVRIDGHAGAGEVRLPGGRSEGTDVDRSESIAAPGRPLLIVDANVGLGELRVEREAGR